MNKSTIVGFMVIGGIGWAWQSGAIPRGESGYRVEFTGTPGAKLYGSTGWLDLNNSKTPIHMDKAEGTLPLTVSLNPPPGATVSASASTLGQGEVTIKIFRNGIECGENPFTGTAALNTKACPPKL
jgi:hypothetical protein